MPIEHWQVRRRRHSLGNAGVAAVEFALVLPLLIILVVGAVIYGSLVYQQTMLEAAVRAGATYAYTHSVTTQSAAGNTSDEYDIMQVVSNAVPYSAKPTVAVEFFCTCIDNTMPTTPKGAVLNGCPITGNSSPCNVGGNTQVLKYVGITASQASWSGGFFFTPSQVKASIVARSLNINICDANSCV